MQKITKILEAKNIEFYGGGNIKSTIGEFLLKFELKCDFDKVGLSEFYFNLDEGIKNNFNFSVYKDYDAKMIQLVIEGSTDNGQRFGICGLEVEDNINE